MSDFTQASMATSVRNVIAAHTQAQDAGRADDVVALYTEDGALTLPGRDPIEGHDALRDAFRGWAPTQPQLHLISNTTIASSGVDEAVAISDVAFFQRGESGWAMQLAGRYEDTLRLVDGTWRIRHRTFQA